MLTMYVIAFVSCATGRCELFYPHPNRLFLSYEVCLTNIPEEASNFNPGSMTGSEIACVRTEREIRAAREGGNIHLEPSAKSGVVGTVRKGEHLAVLGRYDKWLEVLSETGLRGFFWVDRTE